jgi:hypothetical protein
LVASRPPVSNQARLPHPEPSPPSSLGGMNTTSPPPPGTIDELIDNAIGEVLAEVIAIVNARLLEAVAQLKAATEAART